MDRDDLHLVPRPELVTVLDYLGDPASPGVFLLGGPGTGKTTLLITVGQELSRQGQPVFGVSLRGVRYPGDLGALVLGAIAASPYKAAVDVARTVRRSKGDLPLMETAAILHRARARLRSPVLLMDAIDESVHPDRLVPAIEELSLELGTDWKFVVASRQEAAAAVRLLRRFRVRAARIPSADGHPRVGILPVTKPHNLLSKIIDDEADWLDTDKIRAAWLLIVASMTASVLPASAPKRLRRNAVGICAALGLPPPPATLLMRALHAAARLLGGTTLRLTAGLAHVEVKLPSGSGGRPGKAPVDVDRFLEEANNLLGQSRRQAVVMADQIDEIAKWNPDNKQKAVLRGLLQAVRDVHPCEHIQFVVFLRTDLYERCDVQEKTKLVSKTDALTWEEEDWLQVLVRRVLANEPFQRLVSRRRDPDGSTNITRALRVLFPPEIEGQPADRWLIDSLRNGNGSISSPPGSGRQPAGPGGAASRQGDGQGVHAPALLG